jgi:hypothetical protein
MNLFLVVMIILVLSGFCCCVCVYELYHDYNNRMIFKTEFIPTNRFNNKILTTGILTNEYDKKYCIDYISTDYEKIFPIYTQNPIHKMNKYTKNYFAHFGYEYEYHYHLGCSGRQYNQFNQLYKFPNYHTKRIIFWEKHNLFKYVSPSIRFNDTPLVLKNNHKIHYASSKIHSANNKSYIIEKYIPCNSEITIFAKQKNDCHKVEFIGPRNKVLDDIASKYYNINNDITTLSLIGLCASLCCFINFFIKN